MRLPGWVLAALLLGVAGAGVAHAACNLIPGTIRAYDGALGMTNRPFAAPGEYLEVALRACDMASPGLSPAATDHWVTVVFTPTNGAARDAVVLTAAADCSSVTPLLAACAAQLGGGTATCVPAAESGLTVGERDGRRYLSFRFPDTDDRLGAPNDDVTLSGPAAIIAGQVGGNVKQEFTVMGDAVNLASRLKDAAPTGSIWVGPDTWRYTRDEFEYRALEPMTLKGKAKPVEVYELLSAKEQLHEPKPKAAEHATELVGRDIEVGLLRACLASLARGEGGIVHVIGEAGLGKSRLLAETFASEEAAAVTVLEGRSLSMGEGLRFHPFVDLFRQCAGIDKEDDDERAVAKLEAAVAAVCGDAAGDVFPFVATLMGLRVEGAHSERLEDVTGEAL